MPAKKNKTAASWPRRIYTTKKIREIAEQNKLNEEEIKMPLLMPISDSPQIVDEITAFVKQVKVRPEPQSVPNPAKSPPYRLALVLLLITLISFLKPWVFTAAAVLNTVIAQGGFFVLRIIQGACRVQGDILSTHYYKVSLQGDLTAFYSIYLLIVFAAFFAFFQQMTWIKRGAISLSLISIAIAANILRVIVAFGLALNYGPAYADRCFQGILACAIYIFVLIVSFLYI